MATKTQKSSRAAAFAAELADLLDRHEVFLHLSYTGRVIACYEPDKDEVTLCQADEYGNANVTGARLRKAIAQPPADLAGSEQ